MLYLKLAALSELSFHLRFRIEWQPPYLDFQDVHGPLSILFLLQVHSPLLAIPKAEKRKKRCHYCIKHIRITLNAALRVCVGLGRWKFPKKVITWIEKLCLNWTSTFWLCEYVECVQFFALMHESSAFPIFQMLPRFTERFSCVDVEKKLRERVKFGSAGGWIIYLGVYILL